jgi:murein DD-endopeptidase MepM/ murein hydrolase activator NlpD
MKLLAGAAVLLATTTLFGGCVADDAAQGGGGSAEGGGDVGATTAPATGPTTSASTGGNEGGGGGGADDCPRARIEVPGGEILNVRPDPSTQNPPVGTLPNGAIVDVVEQVTGEVIEGNDVWLSIQSGSLAGYVSAAFAVCTTEEPPEPPDGYYVPLACGTSATITQGNNGSTSHNGPTSQYAFDLGLPLNTEILAMADGTVAFIYDQTGPGDPCYNGGGSECVAYANYVVLRHADNTMTAYKHLNQVLVAVGDVVARGHVVGLSGTTGWSTGRHLHVVREEDCGAASCTSVPLSFVDFPSNGGVPVTGDVVTSGNCP